MIAHQPRLFPENLRDEFARAHRAGIRFRHRDDLPDLIGRNARAYRAIARQRRGGGHHWVNAEIWILQGAKLTFQEDILARFQSFVYVNIHITHIGRDQVAVLHKRIENFFEIQQRLMVDMRKHEVFHFQHAR